MIFVITFLIVIIPVGASTADIVDESQSWLARQLETYGVPSAIAAVIAAVGTYLAIFLGTRGFKKSKGSMIAALERIGLSADTLNNVLEKINLVEKRLEEVELKSQKNMEITYQERVLPLLDMTKKTLDEIYIIKDELKNGALKTIQLLTDPINDDEAGV
jgi:hypothetical protein